MSGIERRKKGKQNVKEKSKEKNDNIKDERKDQGFQIMCRGESGGNGHLLSQELPGNCWWKCSKSSSQIPRLLGMLQS